MLKVCGQPGKPGGLALPRGSLPSAAASPMGKSGLKQRPAPSELRQRSWGQAGPLGGIRTPGDPWDPLSPRPRGLPRAGLGTSRRRLRDELGALPKSRVQEKQLLGRNPIRTGLGGRSSFCLRLCSCPAKSQAGPGDKSWMQMLGAGRAVLCSEKPLAGGSAAGSVRPFARVLLPIRPQIPGASSGQSKAAKGLGRLLPRPHPGWKEALACQE